VFVNFVSYKHCIETGTTLSGNEIRAIFGQRIKAFRNRRNWSQADLAEYANISPNYLGDIERGKKWPHPDTLSKLADAFGVKVYEFFLEENMAISPDAKTLMGRFVKDVSIAVNKSMSLSVTQSIEHIKKQYKLDESPDLYKNQQKIKIENFVAENAGKK